MVFARWSLTIFFAVTDCSSLLSIDTCHLLPGRGSRIRGKNKWPPTFSFNGTLSILSWPLSMTHLLRLRSFIFPPWLSRAAPRGEPIPFRRIVRFSSLFGKKFRGFRHAGPFFSSLQTGKSGSAKDAEVFGQSNRQ